MTSLLMWCSSPPQGKHFTLLVMKQNYFHMYIFISEFVIHYVVGIRLFNLAPVRNAIKTCNSWLLPHTTIQPLTTVVDL